MAEYFPAIKCLRYKHYSLAKGFEGYGYAQLGIDKCLTEHGYKRGIHIDRNNKEYCDLCLICKKDKK